MTTNAANVIKETYTTIANFERSCDQSGLGCLSVIFSFSTRFRLEYLAEPSAGYPEVPGDLRLWYTSLHYCHGYSHSRFYLSPTCVRSVDATPPRDCVLDIFQQYDGRQDQ